MRARSLGRVLYCLYDGAAVTPLPRTVRQVSVAALLSALMVVGVLAALAAPASAQEDAAAQPGSPPLRLLTIGVLDEACPEGAKAPCWDTNTLVARPGDKVSLVADLTTSGIPHNIVIRETGVNVEGVEYSPAASSGDGTRQAPKSVHIANFTVPAGYEGAWRYICLVHPTTMVGTLATPDTAAATSEKAEPVSELGVNFLSYWVGIIAFMVLFLVYGATFFLFKHNETNATTDHWDRPGSEAGTRRFSAGVASLIAVVIAAVILGGLVYAARLS